MMIRARGFRFEMTLDQDVIRVQQFAKYLEDIKPTILKAMGVQAVSWAVQDYRKKSDGGTAQGVTWKPITASAIRTRLAGRTPYQRQSSELKTLSERQKPITEALRRKMPKGAEHANKRKAIANKFMESKEGKELSKIQKKRKGIRDKRKATIAKELGSARIGVDTGRLVNSLVYGVQDLASIKPPARLTGDAPPRAAFDIQGNNIRIGSNLKYAGYFDEKRPVFSGTFMDTTRRDQMDRLIEKTTALEFKRKFGGPFNA